MEAAIHPVYDTGERFKIEPLNRAIKCETHDKIYLVKDDHNSEVFTFEMPRFIEGHDMLLCNKVEVHYINTNSSTKETSSARYTVADFAVDPRDSEKVIFSWPVSRKATVFAGTLAFALHFACINESTRDTRYWWSTASCNIVTVLDSVSIPPEESGEETDLQEKWAIPSQTEQVITPDGEYRGLSKVFVAKIPPQYFEPSGTLEVTRNGSYFVDQYHMVLAAVPTDAKLQEKTVTENGTVTPDAGYDGLAKVTVNVPQNSPLPVEVETEAAMDRILSLATSAQIGAVYKFTGASTTKYESGALYIINSEEEA